MADLPATFKGAQVIEFGKELQVNEIPIPELKEGEVLIRVEAAPINQSDLIQIGGLNYTNKQLPAVFGLEGSGVLVKKHESVTHLNVGAKVAFISFTNYGTYGQYSVASAQTVLTLPEDLPFQVGASAIVNPVTVLLMLEEAKSLGAKAVINTAAASALGRQFVRYFQENGIEVINIVRREEQEQLLKKEGAKHVLNSSTPTFLDDLKNLITQLNATVLFDAISGELTGQILALLPQNSTSLSYGVLSGQPFQVNPGDILLKNKTIRGFSLFNAKHAFNPFSNPEALKKLHELLTTSLQTNYANEYSLNQINEAIAAYKSNFTAGKILIRPNQ